MRLSLALVLAALLLVGCAEDDATTTQDAAPSATERRQAADDLAEAAIQVQGEAWLAGFCANVDSLGAVLAYEGFAKGRTDANDTGVSDRDAFDALRRRCP